MLNERNCKLYREFYDIIHPSISRKNITNYEIILEEDLPPVKVFYPKKEVELTNIVIYIHGETVNPHYYEELAIHLEQIVFVLDYSKNECLDDCKKALTYILEEAEKNNILRENITVMGDFKGTAFILELGNEINPSYYQELRKVLLSPVEIDLSNCSLIHTIVFSNHEEMKVNPDMKLFFVKESIYDFVNDVNPYTFSILANKIKNQMINEM